MNINPVKTSIIILSASLPTLFFATNNREQRNNNEIKETYSAYQILPEYLKDPSYSTNCWNYKINDTIKSDKIAEYETPEFIKKCDSLITGKGITDSLALKSAPSPKITIQGDTINARIVVDLSRNVLFYYDKDGTPKEAYKVASGKPSMPTKKGIRRVTHKETYPYSSAPETTNRRKNPKAFGPKIICLEIVDPETGKKSTTPQFIHGTNVPSSIGEYASHGCIRMLNEVITDLADKVKRNDYVLIQ